MPEIVAIIPARWASTRFPGKPLHLIAGRPLIQHVWERTSRARGISRAIVATDDRRIARVVENFGGDVAMTSTRHRTGTDRLAEVARGLPRARAVLNIQGDEPLVDPRLISRLAAALASDPKLEMITAASPFGPADDPSNPNQVKVVFDREGWALFFSRSILPFQRDPNFCGTRYRHHGIYGYSTGLLRKFVSWKPTPLEKTEQLEQLRALEHGVRIKVLLTRHFSIGVDTPGDAAECERLLRSKRSPTSIA